MLIKDNIPKKFKQCGLNTLLCKSQTEEIYFYIKQIESYKYKLDIKSQISQILKKKMID